MSAGARIERIALNCADPRTLALFYEQALGFTRVGARSLDEIALAQLLGIGAVRAQFASLQLGSQRLDLMHLDPGGQPYPGAVAGTSPLFQHFAMEIPDMAAAYARLVAHAAWVPISTGGPQRLPPNTGSVTAFKFRDPEGHPLELISVPGHDTIAAGINHSAISVRATEPSVAFYAQLGLRRTGGSMNTGAEQARLDGIPDAPVEVTTLAAAASAVPHLELLCYQDRFVPAAPPAANDIAATWLIFAVTSAADLIEMTGAATHGRSTPVRSADGVLRSLFPDPDGHWLCLESI